MPSKVELKKQIEELTQKIKESSNPGNPTIHYCDRCGKKDPSVKHYPVIGWLCDECYRKQQEAVSKIGLGNPGNPTCAPCGKAALDLYQAADALHYVVSRPKVYLFTEESHEGAARHVEAIISRIKELKDYCGLDTDRLKEDAKRLKIAVNIFRWDDAKKILADITADLDMALTPPFKGGKG